MKCPFCGAQDTQVKDSRQTLDNKSVKRRRYCTSCGYRFTTYERIEMKELTVVKKDKTKRPFDRQKLFKSIRLAVRKRSISDEQIEMIIDNIVQNIEKSGESEVQSTHIGEMVMENLSQLDDVAYVRFASVYHDFSEVKDFEALLKNIHKRKKSH